jgi:hypothetical protein
VLGIGKGLTATMNRQNNTPHPIEVSIDDLKHLLGQDFPADHWQKAEDLVQLQRTEDDLNRELGILRSADFGVLANRDDFTLGSEDGQCSFSVLVERHIKSEVGRSLITEGYIDRNYALYVSQYYGDHVPVTALNFIVQNVYPNRTDVNYELKDEEIAAVIAETNGSFFSDTSAYNIDILGYLLKRKDPGAFTILDSAIRNSDDSGHAFLRDFLADGKHQDEAVEYVARSWAGIFSLLVSGLGLTHQTRTELFDIALANSTRSYVCEKNAEVLAFLQSNYTSFSTIIEHKDDGKDRGGEPPEVRPVSSEFAAEQAMHAMCEMDFMCDDISALNQFAKKAVIQRKRFSLTSANLQAVLGKQASMSLDHIRAFDRELFYHVLANFNDYLRAIEEDSDGRKGADSSSPDLHAELWVDPPFGSGAGKNWTVEDPQSFSAITNDLPFVDDDKWLAIVSRAHPRCVIDELSAVPNHRWNVLAKTQRFPATLSNVDAYLSHIGELDADLAKLLLKGQTIAVTTSCFASSTLQDSVRRDKVAAAKSRIATHILGASKTIPDPTVRVRLVSSLQLDACFPVANVEPEAGPLLGLLLGENICEDEFALFLHFVPTDWETLRFAIEKSLKFTQFMTPRLLDVGLTIQLLESDIRIDVQKAVLTRFDDFIPTGDNAALGAAGRAALQTETHLTCSQIASIALVTKDADLAVKLLNLSNQCISNYETSDVLDKLEIPYNQLRITGAKIVFPGDEHHVALLERLQEEGSITLKKRRRSTNQPAQIEVLVK